ncbi:MAG TPA: glycoside hydrolase family 2 TIM barrel-domain containing protein, partial [Tepidisphaeraceae bacterium]|nr:glycoside hydrolase family 2 TIM barrel-domain containing protein [Tepidisphaeraceae bacterium]
MTRRFLPWCALLISIVCASCANQSAPTTSVAGISAPPRVVKNLSPNWKFIRQDVPGAEQPAFDDSSWDSINLPHTWNARDGEDGTADVKANPRGDYYRGVGWYRRQLTLDPNQVKGKSVFLRFDAASIEADVFVNGKHAGNHKGMFAAFCFDVTPLLNASGDNIIAVKVNNAMNPDIPPLNADFTFFGGLYRGVNVLVLDPLSITPLDDASSGVYVKQAKVDADHADLEITTKLRNADSATKSASVKCEVLDAGGNVVQSSNGNAQVAAGADADSVQTIGIDHPHLWNAKKDPYLYQVRVTVSDGSNVVDRVTQPLGIRFFKADPDQGFFLNGASYPLHGVNRHQDRPDKGWAISPADHAEDFALIMEMGCTGIRLAHYQHAQEFYDLCDKGGLVVWAEACLVNEVTASQAFDDVARQQVRELVKQNFNHPAICFWSLFNELRDPGGVKGEQLEIQRKHQIDLVSSLNDEAHQLDPSRLTTGATNQPKPEYELNKITDVIAFNRYDGWYRKAATDWPKELDDTKAALPGRAIGISEYGAGGGIHMHEANPPRKPKGTVQAWHPEEWQCYVHEQAYGAMKQRPWLWGTFLWNMFDFAADNRHEGEHAGINDKGMVTYDRKVKKDVFFFYKANWTQTPVTYIAERRHTDRVYRTAPVKVYSNATST